MNKGNRVGLDYGLLLLRVLIIPKIDQRVFGSEASLGLGAPLPPTLFAHGLAALRIRHSLTAIVKRSASGLLSVV